MGRTSGRHGLTIDNSPNSKLSDSGDTGPLLEISILEEGGRGICGSVVAGGARFCISSLDECNTDLHTRLRGFRYGLQGGKWGVWLFLASSASRLPLSVFYQIALSGSTASKVKNFEGMTL